MIQIIFTRKRLLVGLKTRVSEILEINGSPVTEISQGSRVALLAEFLPRIAQVYRKRQELSRVKIPGKIPLSLVFPIDTPLKEVGEVIQLLQEFQGELELIHLDNLVMPFMYGLDKFEERIAVPCVIVDGLDDQLSNIYFHRPAKIDAGSFFVMEEEELSFRGLSKLLDRQYLDSLGIGKIYLMGRYLHSENLLDLLIRELGLRDKIVRISNADPLIEYKIVMKGLGIRANMQSLSVPEQLMEREFKLQNWQHKFNNSSELNLKPALETQWTRSEPSKDNTSQQESALSSHKSPGDKHANVHLNEKDAEILNLKKTLENRVSRLKDLEWQIESRIEEVTYLEEQLRRDRGVSEELKKEIAVYKEEMAVLKESLTARELELEHIRPEKTELEKKVRYHEEEIEKINQLLSKKNSEIEDFHMFLESKDSEIRKLNEILSYKREEVSYLKIEVKEKAEEIADLKTEPLVKEPGENEGIYSGLEKEIDEQKAEIQTLNVKLEASYQQIQTLQQNLAERESLINQFQGREKGSEKEIDSLKEIISQKDLGIKELESYIEEVEERLKSVTQRTQTMEENLHGKEVEIQRLRSDVQHLSDKRGEIQIKNAPEAASEVRQLQEQLLIFEKENQKLERELSLVRDEVEQQTALKEKISVMEQEWLLQKERTMNRLAELEAEILASNELSGADGEKVQDGDEYEPSRKGIQKLLKSGQRLRGWF